MARIRVKREPDGTYTVKGTRTAGKQLVGQKIHRGLKRADVGKAAAALLRELGNPGDKVKTIADSAGKGRIG